MSSQSAAEAPAAPQLLPLEPVTKPRPGELRFSPPRRGKAPTHVADLAPEQLRERIQELGLPAFRAKQVARQVFVRHSADPTTWTDLPETDRDLVQEALLPELLQQIRTLTCDNNQTRKTVSRLFDGALIESVLMRYPDRATLCVSSQVGCGMNCPFCATGQAGLTRNLSAAEIVEQVRLAAAQCEAGQLGDSPTRLSNLVFMGMGEPLANYKSMMTAIRRIIAPDPWGMGMSARGITVSTVGLVPAIRKLVREELPLRLAVSLHAPDDELRDTLVPINNRWKVAEVLEAAWEYAAASGRRISIEYALIKDINDQAWRADELARLLQGKLVHVNLIPLNPTPGSKWTASRKSDEQEFIRRLREAGISTTLRDTRGQEIDGACGQLAATTAADERAEKE